MTNRKQEPDLRQSATEPSADKGALDPGAFIGHEPELAAERIPGGLRSDDERVAAHSTQGTGAGRPDQRGQPAEPAGGHRQAGGESHDARDAGRNR